RSPSGLLGGPSSRPQGLRYARGYGWRRQNQVSRSVRGNAHDRSGRRKRNSAARNRRRARPPLVRVKRATRILTSPASSPDRRSRCGKRTRKRRRTRSSREPRRTARRDPGVSRLSKEADVNGERSMPNARTDENQHSASDIQHAAFGFSAGLSGRHRVNWIERTTFEKTDE